MLRLLRLWAVECAGGETAHAALDTTIWLCLWRGVGGETAHAAFDAPIASGLRLWREDG